MVEIMTPDTEPGCPVDEARSFCWSYQRNNDWHASILNYKMHVCAMLQNMLVGEVMLL
jgi:hypothetical protein